MGVGYFLLFPKGAPIAALDHGNHHIVLIGHAVDPDRNSSDRARILRHLAGALPDGRFEEEVSQLAGRFVVIHTDQSGPLLYQDAAGSQAVFYRSGIAASHSELAAIGADRYDGDVMRIWDKITKTSPGVKYLPGIRAPHEGVRMLTPNTRLHVPTATPERFWPKVARLESDDINAIAHKVATQLSNTAVQATSAWNLLMSLTAGIDSRLTLAACRSVAQKLGFFSHINPDTPHRIHVTDLAMAQDMANQLGLDHRVVPMGDSLKTNGYDDFHQVWLRNLGNLNRGIPTLMWSYVNSWPRETLHLRSNVAEIGRVFYKGPRLERVTPHGLTGWWNPDLTNDPDALDSFAEFCEVAEFNDKSMLGYDPLDLFYWEHRMGHWHAWLCLESDISHYTFPLYSNRRLLTKMLQAPFDARMSAAVFHRAIDRLWPELSDWPINPKKWGPKSTE